MRCALCTRQGTNDVRRASIHRALPAHAHTCCTCRLRHQVVLADNTSFAYCGGALVVTDGNPARNDAVLTAAHCTCATTDSAVAGANTRPDAFMGTVPTSGAPRVVRFLPHPQYVDSSATGNNQNQANDVALVFLSACVPPSAAVAPIRLATQQELDANNARTWIVSGVGTTSKNANVSTGMDGDTPSILQVRMRRAPVGSGRAHARRRGAQHNVRTPDTV